MKGDPAAAEPRSRVLLENGPVRIKRGRHGLLAYSRHDSFVGRSIDLYGEWSPGDAEMLTPYLRPGMTALDVGANIGAMTLFLADAVGPSGRVLAFEPVPALHRLLVCNLALNGLDQVEARAAAVGAEAGRVRVPDLDLAAPGNFGATTLDGEAASVAVEVVTIDDLDLPACDLIKADVEGHEDAVVAGAARTVSRFRPMLYLVNEEPALSPALISRVMVLGYRLWWHAPTLFRPDNWFGAAENVFPAQGSLNLFCLPAERRDRPGSLAEVSGPDDWPSWWPEWAPS